MYTDYIQVYTDVSRGSFVDGGGNRKEKALVFSQSSKSFKTKQALYHMVQGRREYVSLLSSDG